MPGNPFGVGDPSHHSVPLRRLATRSPSPSRSPTRGDGFTAHALDPLLSDLSPSKTLEALSYSPTFVGNGGRSGALQASIAVASPTQRAFAVRAALAHKKLREWSVELSSWEWPSDGKQLGTSRGFQVPPWEERAAKRRRTDDGRYERKDSWGVVTQNGERDPTTEGKARLEVAMGPSPEFGASDGSVTAGVESDDEYWGSLPARRVLKYEKRVEAIKGEMEALDLEELKNQVLDAHIPSRSRPSPPYDQLDDDPSLENYVPLGDFTALVTATTLQALPYLSRIMSLLNLWVARIAVLRVVPKFLINLEEVEDLLEMAFGAIVSPRTAASLPSSQRGKSSEGHSDSGILRPLGLRDERSRLLPIPAGGDFTRGTFNIVREMLEQKVTSLGQLLDSMLDDLEGRDDTIPEEWIEKMEAVEESYGNWVVEAEKKVLEAEWRQSLQAQAEQPRNAPNGERMDVSGSITDKTEVDGECPGEDEVSSHEVAIGVAHDLAPGDTSEKNSALRSPDLLPVQEANGARDCDWTNAARDMIKVTRVKEDAGGNWEVNGEVVRDPAPDEVSKDIPTVRVSGLSPAQQVDYSPGCGPADGLDLGEDVIKVIEIKEDKIRSRETTPGDIPALQGPRSSLPQQVDGARDCKEATLAGEALGRDMTDGVGVTKDITELPQVAPDQALRSISTSRGLDLVPAQQVIDTRAVEEVGQANVQNHGEVPDEVDPIEDVTRIAKVANGQPRGGVANGLEADSGAANDLVRDALGHPPAMPDLPSPPPVSVAPIIGNDSETNTTGTVSIQSSGIYSTTETKDKGQGLPLNTDKRPETPPLQYQQLSGSPIISSLTFDEKAGSRSPLGTVDSGGTHHNISHPGKFVNITSVETSSTDHTTNIENSASPNSRTADKSCIMSDPTNSDSIDTLPNNPVWGQCDLQIIDTEARSVGLPIGHNPETELPSLDSPWTSPVRPDFDSDNSQNSPNPSIQSSSPGLALQLRDLELQKFGRPTDNVTPQSPIKNIPESPSLEISTENLAMAVENIGFRRRSDQLFNKEDLKIRDTVSEIGFQVSASERTNGIAEVTEESNICGDDQPEATPSKLVPQFGGIDRPIGLDEGELPQEEPATGAKVNEDDPSPKVNKKAIELDSVDFPSPPGPVTSATNNQLSDIPSKPLTPDSLELSSQPNSVDSDNFQATTERHGQFNWVEADYSTPIAPSPPNPSCSPELVASEILQANSGNHGQSNRAGPASPTQFAVSPQESSNLPEQIASESPHETRENNSQVNPAKSDPPSPRLLVTTADAAVAGTVPTGEGVLAKPDENSDPSLKVVTPVAVAVRPNRQTYRKDRQEGDSEVPMSDGTPEASQHVRTRPFDIVRTRSPYNSPFTLDHAPEDAGPRTPTSPASPGDSTVSQGSEPPTPLPSLPAINTEEQSPSVRQYMRKHDTVNSEDDPLGSLPALQIPKRRQRTYSGPGKPLVTPGRPQQENGDWAGAGSEDNSGRSRVELSKATTLESPAENADDHLEQKINSILTTIPTRIRLSSEIEVEPSPSGRSSPPKSYATISPGVRPLRATSASPSFTLAPAYAKNPRTRAKGSNPDTKLYHLHRSNGEAPIKLLVRLVGENGERVMVRVGGGWADLGEYLKEYATHHGRRSASDGRIEIQDVPRLNSRSSVTSLKAQAGGRSTPTSRPDSALGRSTSSLSFARTRPAPSTPPTETRTPTTPNFPISRRQELTPPSNGSSASVSVSSPRSSSRLSWTEDEPAPALGLAGPKGRKVDMAPDKQAWVEGMLGQVRKASAQKREVKREEGDFGSLGKIGATKRVFRRGSKGAGGGELGG